MDDISAGFVSGLNDELTEEENRRHWASLGNIAHRYPLNHELWDKMEDISIEGAALYSFGIDPAAIQLEMESPEDNALDELPKDFRERLSIIKSAVRAGTTIKRAPINGSDPGGWDDHTRILKASFLEWCDKNPDTCAPAEKLPTYPQYQPKDESEEPVKPQQTGTQPESSHDPLLLDGIALIFILDKEKEENLRIWKKHAHNASRKNKGEKLAAARTQIIGGKSQSYFDPVRVGDWLVATGKMPRDRVDRILLNNLPSRSAYL